MDALVAIAAGLAAIAAAVVGIPRMIAAERSHQRQRHEAGDRGVDGFGVVDELFNPSARNAVFERQTQQEFQVPAPSPADPPYDTRRIRITVPPPPA